LLDIKLLGRPDVSISGHPVVVDTRKAIALLAYLVVEKSASRDSLSALFWADASQERARATLRRTLSALRGATGTDLIEADRNLVTLVGEVTSDLEILSRELNATSEHGHDPRDVCDRCIPHLRRATELYRGDFLEGFSVRASPEFDDWVRSVAESTRIRIGEAFHRLGTALAAAGEYPAAITAVTQWIQLDPLHEPAHRFLMLLHAWAGDRPGAIEAYRNCVTILDQELGVAPLEETTELYEAILDEDLPPAPGAPRTVKAETPARRETQPDLIDREVELDQLHEALRSTANEEGRVYAMTGAPWMGKTRLLEELASDAARDRDVLIGRAFRMEQTLPYGVATQVLTGATRIEARRAEIPDWALNEIGRILPGIAPAATESTPDRFGELRLLEGIHTVMSVLARDRPLLVILDDAQWMDTASAAVFSYLARRISETPMLMVVAARTEDDLLPAVAEMMGSADQSIAIRPLTVQHLIALVGDDEAKARRLREKTGGVPLLVNEALATDMEALPATPGMARFMEARLLEIDDLGRQILTAAAVLNGICDATLLRETSGRSEEEVVEAVEELVAAGLLREIPESEGLSFTLDALERVTYDTTSLVRRRLLHRRAARALTERGHARTDARLAAAVAGQYRAAGDPEAADWYHLAGDLARSVFANDSAQQFYETALALDDSDVAGARLALGELAMAAGDYDRARRELTLASSRAGPESIGVIEHLTGEVERLLGRFDDAEEHFQRSIQSHPAPAAVLADWALLSHRTGDVTKAASLAERAREAAEAEGDPGQLSRVRNILAVVTPDHDEALGHVEEAIRLAGDDDLLRMAALNNKALLLAENRDTGRSIELLEEAIGIAERTGHRHREAALWNHLADLHHRDGREDEARQSLTTAVSLFADIDSGELEPELWLLSRW
jgi:DNA-binding SARP family transcriptional activator/Flp pilus assembly protein TadD